MPRKNKPRILDEAPLVYTIGQVAFSPVLAMDTYISKIQEALRKNDFPKLTENNFHAVNLGADNSSPFTATLLKSWAFSNKDDTMGITITNSFVNIETTDYSSFDLLIGKLELVLTILGKIVGISLVQRIGLRYVDLIKLKPNEQFSDYLCEGLLGFKFFKDTDLNITNHVSQTVANTDEGKLAVRTMRTNEGLQLPPDLLPSRLKTDPNKQALPGEWVTFLDFDHFSEKQRDYNVKEIIDCLWRLHELTGDAFFENAITDTAKKRWGFRS